MVLVACAAIGLGVSRLSDAHQCSSAKAKLNVAIYQRAVVNRAPDTRGLPAAQDTMVATCRDRTDLARLATVEQAVGLTALGVSLARRVVALEPRNRQAWLALALVLDKVDPAGSDAARRRAHALDPRGVALPSA